MSDSGEFARVAEPFRRELLAHCYRMLGSVDDAEDLVQETYLRAWRSFAGFEGRASLRTWLYRIATNACLTVLEQRERRPLPAGLGGPSDDPAVSVAEPPGIAWLQPMPDALVDSSKTDPAAIVTSRSSMRLAFVAALQHLPARQRAVLILRDVLGWRAREVADLLGTTSMAVKSTLQRARAQIAQVAPVEEELVEPTGPDLRRLLDQYITAFENADATALMRLLREDATLEMPPLATWFTGREAIGSFAAARIFGPPGGVRMIPTGANGQPAMAAYRRDDDGRYWAHAIHVLTAATTGIVRIVAFLDPDLFAAFGLPQVHAAAESALAAGLDGRP
ncbi:sigma-70 family RNA polymerase sigma factor [Saccharopolyspora sp. K220]|uniref:sigma-70 family RNA polymerase sigma factor n=1 Tax=Saccharopolyspora soli TaxID=2926618 RepID=UPI001F563857|nr:sigma-70 family RNA polymerase sigma factor [Saccharopolyspora soli]MCI2421641.1 sigma-70 family RNA polymerase sigma factor [Saccharopolyspora soli]